MIEWWRNRVTSKGVYDLQAAYNGKIVLTLWKHMERVIYLLSLGVILFVNKKAQESIFYFFCIASAY